MPIEESKALVKTVRVNGKDVSDMEALDARIVQMVSDIQTAISNSPTANHIDTPLTAADVEGIFDTPSHEETNKFKKPEVDDVSDIPFI